MATEVDHIISREKALRLRWSEEQVNELSNLQAINEECHRRKTQEERGNEYRPKRKVGLDGFPVA